MTDQHQVNSSSAGAVVPPAPPSPTETDFHFTLDGQRYGAAQMTAAIRAAEVIFAAYEFASEELGCGARSINWASLDEARDHAHEALSEKQRRSIKAAIVADSCGVQPNGAGIVIHTVGDLDDLEVEGSDVAPEFLTFLLAATPVLRVKNQDGVALDLFYDMDGETLIAEVPAGKESVPSSDTAEPPQYLFEFPDFGLLDVQLPDGFIDQSWHGNTCPSFELAAQDPSAEWPQFTLFIDYLDTSLRHEPDAPRFHLYRDADLEKPVVQSDLWSDVLNFVSQHRVTGAL